MTVDVEEINSALVVKPKFRRLDAASAASFRDQVAPRIRDRRLVVIALGDVEFVDSSGLGSLVMILKRLPAGGVLRLAEVSGPLQAVLRLTRLDKVIQSFASVELAVA